MPPSVRNALSAHPLLRDAAVFAFHFTHGLVVVAGTAVLGMGAHLAVKHDFSLDAMRAALQPRTVMVKLAPAESNRVAESIPAVTDAERAAGQPVIRVSGNMDARFSTSPRSVVTRSSGATEQWLERRTAKGHNGVPKGMQPVVADLSRRYRVGNDAMETVVGEAAGVSRRLGLDPYVIVAMVAIESSFNPIAQSVAGAQGLMQIMPQFHRDKLVQVAAHPGEASFYHPQANIRVGATILKEAIQKTGGLVQALQWYSGSANDPEREYATKVLAEARRLKAIARDRTPLPSA